MHAGVRAGQVAELGELAEALAPGAVVPLAEAAMALVGQRVGRLHRGALVQLVEHVDDEGTVVVLRAAQQHARGRLLHAPHLGVELLHHALDQHDLLRRFAAGVVDAVRAVRDRAGRRFDVGRGRLHAARQVAHFVGDHRETTAGVTGARGLDGRVQRQQIGLVRDLADGADDGIDRLDLAEQLGDRDAVALHGAADALDDVGGAVHRLRDRRRRTFQVVQRRAHARGHVIALQPLGDVVAAGVKRQQPAAGVAQRRHPEREGRTAHAHRSGVLGDFAAGQPAQHLAYRRRVRVHAVHRRALRLAHVGVAAQRRVEIAVQSRHRVARGRIHVDDRMLRVGVGVDQHLERIERIEGLLQQLEVFGLHGVPQETVRRGAA
ncbi:hypothetical protein GALL_370460 [mine drainage metagenome]|uniref:Uncharacterized protein n=1 Tax=mine drainage metagenome TaxID=410659 RepID=A0A1J5QMP1_9ZZZZ